MRPIVITRRFYIIGGQAVEVAIYITLDNPYDINAAVTKSGDVYLSMTASTLSLTLQHAMLAHELGHKALHIATLSYLSGRQLKEELEADAYGANLVGCTSMLAMLRFLVQEHEKTCQAVSCPGMVEVRARIEALEALERSENADNGK